MTKWKQGEGVECKTDPILDQLYIHWVRNWDSINLSLSSILQIQISTQIQLLISSILQISFRSPGPDWPKFTSESPLLMKLTAPPEQVWHSLWSLLSTSCHCPKCLQNFLNYSKIHITRVCPFSVAKKQVCVFWQFLFLSQPKQTDPE